MIAKILPLLLLSQFTFADLSDYSKEGCQSAVGWKVAQKISDNTYLVEFSTSSYAGDDCVRKSNIPGGCIAVAVLKTLKPFSTSGEISGHVHIKKVEEKLNLKKEDGFQKNYQVFQENSNCENLLNKVNKEKAKTDPVYDCNKNGNAESCYKAGMKMIKEAIYLTGPWHNGRDLVEKACKKGHQVACRELENLKTSSDF